MHYLTKKCYLISDDAYDIKNKINLLYILEILWKLLKLQNNLYIGIYRAKWDTLLAKLSLSLAQGEG